MGRWRPSPRRWPLNDGNADERMDQHGLESVSTRSIVNDPGREAARRAGTSVPFQVRGRGGEAEWQSDDR